MPFDSRQWCNCDIVGILETSAALLLKYADNCEGDTAAGECGADRIDCSIHLINDALADDDHPAPSRDICVAEVVATAHFAVGCFEI